MAKGVSINIGLDSVRASFGFDDLFGCENDARAMYNLARSVDFTGDLPLLGAQATTVAVRAAIQRASQDLADGDILLLTFSGHGATFPDFSGDEADGMDEGWVLFDDYFIDDELYDLLTDFQPGVRVVVVSDSCHSGTIVRILANTRTPKLDTREFSANVMRRFERRAVTRFALEGLTGATKVNVPQPKTPSLVAITKEYSRNNEFYDRLVARFRVSQRRDLSASVILLAACQDDQNSASASSPTGNSLFTQGLLEVWANGSFAGGYQEFIDAIATVTPGQFPNLLPLGPNVDAFLRQRPFRILP